MCAHRFVDFLIFANFDLKLAYCGGTLLTLVYSDAQDSLCERCGERTVGGRSVGTVYKAHFWTRSPNGERCWIVSARAHTHTRTRARALPTTLTPDDAVFLRDCSWFQCRPCCRGHSAAISLVLGTQVPFVQNHQQAADDSAVGLADLLSGRPREQRVKLCEKVVAPMLQSFV